MRKTFYSNGKLLITGEYVVLNGADAFALPTKGGQYLSAEPNDTNFINWKSLDEKGRTWYEDKIEVSSITNNSYTGDNAVTAQLVKILHIAHLANTKLLSVGYDVYTELTFPRNWGLGTSSTLINNIAQWFGIDAYGLLWDSFGGSGYDIACAQHEGAIIYSCDERIPSVKQIDFNPSFTPNLYFVYLNQKQDSRSAIEAYRKKQDQATETVSEINAITAKIVKTRNLDAFCALLEAHEATVSAILERPPVKEILFPDFKGAVKSLGAWGGDFVLAAAPNDPTLYFKSKGYHTVISYQDMIK